jgi:16S rRNA (cytosine967-C5)-methyltransferase
VRALQQVFIGRSLTEGLPPVLAQSNDPRDRRFIQELCYGVLRWYLRLDGVLRQLLHKPLKAKDRDISTLLLIGLYQLEYLRVADHAAVYETAETAKKLRKHWAVSLINGVLREYQRRREALFANLVKDPAAEYAMPAWLLTRLQQRWPDHWQACIKALNGRPPLCLRVNRQRVSRADYLQRLLQAGIPARAIEFTRSGVVLERPSDVLELPGFSEGLVSVQDGGAQLAADILLLKPGLQVLDACAAPGGKTGHLLESAQPLKLTAVDLDETRLFQVRENLQRLSFSAEILQGDAAKPTGSWTSQQYDRILLDVPCSATGVLRRHPDIKYLRRPTDIPPLVALQARILRNTWRLLKPGGIMLYVTCSILPEENQLQVAKFLQQQFDAREHPIDAQWGEACIPGRQVAPGMHDMDGFYYARLEKLSA